MDQGIGDFTPCFVEVPPHGAARDPEGGRCFLLLKPLEIDQFQEFKFLGEEHHHFLTPQYMALGGVTADRTLGFNLPAYPRPASWPYCFRMVDCILHCIHRIIR